MCDLFEINSKLSQLELNLNKINMNYRTPPLDNIDLQLKSTKDKFSETLSKSKHPPVKGLFQNRLQNSNKNIQERKLADKTPRKSYYPGRKIAPFPSNKKRKEKENSKESDFSITLSQDQKLKENPFMIIASKKPPEARNLIDLELENIGRINIEERKINESELASEERTLNFFLGGEDSERKEEEEEKKAENNIILNNRHSPNTTCPFQLQSNKNLSISHMDINIEAHNAGQIHIPSRSIPSSIHPLNSHPLILSNKKHTQTHLAQISYPPHTNTNTNTNPNPNILSNHPNPILQEHHQINNHNNNYNNGLGNMNIGYNGPLQQIKFIYDNRIKITKTLHLHGLTVRDTIHILQSILYEKRYIDRNVQVGLVLLDNDMFEIDENDYLIQYVQSCDYTFYISFKKSGPHYQITAQGSFDVLDVPLQIIDFVNQNNMYYFKIKWKKRQNGFQPFDSYVEEGLLNIHHPEMVYQFFSSFVKSSIKAVPRSVSFRRRTDC